VGQCREAIRFTEVGIVSRVRLLPRPYLSVAHYHIKSSRRCQFRSNRSEAAAILVLSAVAREWTLTGAAASGGGNRLSVW